MQCCLWHGLAKVWNWDMSSLSRKKSKTNNLYLSASQQSKNTIASNCAELFSLHTVSVACDLVAVRERSRHKTNDTHPDLIPGKVPFWVIFRMLQSSVENGLQHSFYVTCSSSTQFDYYIIGSIGLKYAMSRACQSTLLELSPRLVSLIKLRCEC